MTDDTTVRAIAAMGSALGPDVVARCRALFSAEQEALAEAMPALASDCAYGPDPRHRLDLYRSSDAGATPLPVLLFVHGGGFVLGDKGGQGGGQGGAGGTAWPNAHVGRWAAGNGMVGAVMNYRLAPDHRWPAGAEDVAAAVAWLRDNAAQLGGDPDRVVLMGTSAGAVHVAGYLRLDPAHVRHVRAAVLLSGLYGFSPLDERDERYYGPASGYAQRMPKQAVADTGLPLFVACSRFDPPRFQAEWAGMMQARLERHGALPWAHFANGHNHYSLAMHLGTTDRRLADELLAFFSEHV